MIRFNTSNTFPMRAVQNANVFFYARSHQIDALKNKSNVRFLLINIGQKIILLFVHFKNLRNYAMVFQGYI